MDASLLISIIEDNPFATTFNEWGVAERGLKLLLSYKKVRVSFEVCVINGLWGGSSQVDTPSAGFGSPITRGSLNFSSLEECIEPLWEHVRNFLYKQNRLAEVRHFEEYMSKWASLSYEEKLRCFKVADFYKLWIL